MQDSNQPTTPSETFHQAVHSLSYNPEGITDQTITDLRAAPLSQEQKDRLERIADILDSPQGQDSATRERACLDARDILERAKPSFPKNYLEFSKPENYVYFRWLHGRCRTLAAELKAEAVKHSPVNRPQQG